MTHDFEEEEEETDGAMKHCVFSYKLFQWKPEDKVLVLDFETSQKLPHHFPISCIAIQGKYEKKEYVFSGTNMCEEYIYLSKDGYDPFDKNDKGILVLIQTKKSLNLSKHKDFDSRSDSAYS